MSIPTAGAFIIGHNSGEAHGRAMAKMEGQRETEILQGAIGLWRKRVDELEEKLESAWVYAYVEALHRSAALDVATKVRGEVDALKTLIARGSPTAEEIARATPLASSRERRISEMAKHAKSFAEEEMARVPSVKERYRRALADFMDRLSKA